ncbi:hypothetical protein G7046_g4723 [Stylonectria norvegica]|nr:hypothetical protein G7046_g4723 [Stylonectria norvegica]
MYQPRLRTITEPSEHHQLRPRIVTEPIEYHLEFDFLVAKEKPGKEYLPEEGTHVRWACPHDEPNPTLACVKYCAKVLEHAHFTTGRKPTESIFNGIGYRDTVPSEVDQRFDFTQITDMGGRTDDVSPHMLNWVFTPAPNAVARKGSPEEYDWVGVKLYCPFRQQKYVYPDVVGRPAEERFDSSSDEELKIPHPGDKFKEVDNALGVLRAGVKMHSNSTCETRIRFRKRDGAFDLQHAKKMLTMCWLLEPNLFLKLRPDVKLPRPITQSSNLAKIATEFPKGGSDKLRAPAARAATLKKTRPSGPSEAKIMDEHIPDLHGAETQEKIQLIWGTKTLEELNNLISCPGSDSAIKIDEHLKQSCPTMLFRYSVWHPNNKNYHYWIQRLGMMFGLAVTQSAAQFKEHITILEQNVVLRQQLEEEDQWKLLITPMLNNAISHYWNDVVKEYKEGGSLPAKNIDEQGLLMPDPGIDYKSDLSSEASTTSSDETYES